MAEFDPFAFMDARVRKHFDKWYGACRRDETVDRRAMAMGFLAGWNHCVGEAVSAVGNLDPDEHPLGAQPALLSKAGGE